MGYYTDYDLSEVSLEQQEQLDKIVGYNISENPIGVKWYNHEQDLLKLSLMYPEDIIEVSGVGEESGDIWIKYFKNGKVQVCNAIISFDSFDEGKLQ